MRCTRQAQATLPGPISYPGLHPNTAYAASLSETVVLPCATGTRQRAEKHSAKDLPSVTFDKEHTASTVPANSSFAKCFLSGTRQRLCRELKTTLGEKKYVTGWKRSRHVCRVSNIRHSAKLAFLPCVKGWALGKACLFAVCQSLGPRQIWPICRVSKW
jgi:hypothetical protein